MRYSLQDLDIIQEVLECNETAMSTSQNTKTELFEHRIASCLSSAFAVAVSSGTAALHMALLSVNVGAGDEVLVDPLFEHGALAALRCNAIPVFYDVNVDTYMTDVDNLKRKISPRTKAVIITNVFGCAADLPNIRDFCKRLKITLIEDCAHSIMSKCNGKHTGTYGDIGVFSFHSSLHLSLGGGGALVTSDKELYERIICIRNQENLNPKDRVCSIYSRGWGYKISELVAAFGIIRLKNIDSIISKYKAIGNWITTNLRSPYIEPQKNYYGDHVFWKWAARVNDKSLFDYLERTMKPNDYLKFGINCKMVVDDWVVFQNLRREDKFTCPYDCIFAGDNSKEPASLDNARAIAKQLLIIEINSCTPIEKYKSIVDCIKVCIDEYLCNKKSDCV